MAQDKNQIVQKVRELLVEELRRIQQKSPGFSMRSFAKKLDVSQGELSEVINGKRKPSSRLIISLYKLLGRRNPEFLEQSKRLHDLGIRKKRRDKNLYRLEEDQFKVIAGWHNFALLSLVETIDFKSDVTWIAQRLGITKQQAQETVERLLHLNLISIENKGDIVLKNEGVKAPDNIISAAVKESHLKDLNLIDKAIRQDLPLEHRDFTSCTYAVNVKNIPKLKNMIRKFQDQVATLLEDGHSDEVYRMSIYFYPLTKIKQSREG